MVPRRPVVSYALRQLKSPLSNINRLDNHLVMATGTFVILGVILVMTRDAWCWQYTNLSGRKTPPLVGDDKHDFKKELKGRLVIVFTLVAMTAQTFNAGLK